MSDYFNTGYPFYENDKVMINKPVKGLKENKIYTVEKVNRGIDGACDFDDVFLVGVEGSFCEFDFRRVKIVRSGK